MDIGSNTIQDKKYHLNDDELIEDENILHHNSKLVRKDFTEDNTLPDYIKRILMIKTLTSVQIMKVFMALIKK